MKPDRGEARRGAGFVQRARGWSLLLSYSGRVNTRNEAKPLNVCSEKYKPKCVGGLEKCLVGKLRKLVICDRVKTTFLSKGFN